MPSVIWKPEMIEINQGGAIDGETSELIIGKGVMVVAIVVLIGMDIQEKNISLVIVVKAK